jgi:hypothetical protein
MFESLASCLAFRCSASLNMTDCCETPGCPTGKMPVLLFARGFDDLGEAARVEAGAADEGAVDAGLAH